jgi:hypothetical protein
MSENTRSDVSRQVAEERRRIGKEQYEAADAGLIAELADAGFTVDSIHDLWDDGDDRLVPILLKWLRRVEYRLLAVDIIRTLAAPWARPHGTPALVKMLAGLDDTNDVRRDGWTIRAAIASIPVFWDSTFVSLVTFIARFFCRTRLIGLPLTLQR